MARSKARDQWRGTGWDESIDAAPRSPRDEPYSCGNGCPQHCESLRGNQHSCSRQHPRPNRVPIRTRVRSRGWNV